MNPNKKSVVKINGRMKTGLYIFWGLAIALFLSANSIVSFADDTDVYQPKVRHNAVILVDTSDSMSYGVYDNDIDYHQFYRYICSLCSGGTCAWKNARDYIAYPNGTGTSAYFYPDSRAYDKTKIYLVYGNIGFNNGVTGDAADPNYLWYTSSMQDTKTWITSSGELVDQYGKHPGESGYEGRVGTVVDSTTGDVMITLDGIRLPNNQDKKLHDWQENPDGSRVDKGFSGLVRAPGYTFSGYFYKGSGDSGLPVNNVSSSYTSNIASASTYDGKAKDYFFITGNWMNMQTVYNLEVNVTGNTWITAWDYCTYPAQYYTPVVDYSMAPPKDADGNYYPSYDSLQDSTSNHVIYNGEASKIKVHFSNISLGAGDSIKLYDENGNSPITITSMPTDGWTGWITGKQVLVRFITDANPATVSTGWKIDSYQYQSKTDYNFFSRLDVATSAIINVVESTRGRVNWGIMGFGETNATPPMNASYNDDQQKQSIITALNGFSATGDSNIAESMDLVLKEFNSKAQQIHKDCNKNFVIVLSDGYADHDTLGTDWGSPVADYAALNSAEASQYHFTQDPFQYANPPADYYDDIAGYMYSHKYTDYTSIPADERADSADNIIVHNIGFSTESPMLKHASELCGDEGIFLTAYSKSQLVNAFYSLGILIAEYTSYTAPVVSVDETNRVQSGDRLYMALFKPNAELYWTGNLKQYGFTYGIKPDCNKTTNEWYVVDRAEKSATTCDGKMLPETTSFWSSGFDGGDVEKGGVGQVLYNNIPVKYGKLDTTLNACDFRKIYTYDSTSGLVRVGTNALTNTALTVSKDTDRYKIVNYIYGYTYDAHTAATALSAGGSPLVEGSPVSKRWPLGPIIHSSPKIIDYLDANNDLVNRYIAVGANDGLLHVFNDDNGQEIFAFIPTEVLPLMKQFDSSVNNHPKKVYTVDGSPALLQFKDSSNVDKKLLVFGLRRGGRAYYALDITDNTNPGNWSVRWKVNNSSASMGELGYTFAMPKQIKIKISTDPDTYANYILVPGGYDTTEDKNEPLADYQLTTAHTCSMGRVIYILNADDGTVFQKFDYNNKSSMKYCFPADPTVVTGPRGVFLAAYMTDLYGQVWKLTYNSTTGFALNLIFKMNPMTDQRSDYYWRNEFKTWVSGNAYPGGTIAFSPALGTDIKNPRKTFYSPEVSYAGNCFTDVPVLYMGTGDREHPTFIGTSTGGYAPVKNGLYAFYDAEAYYKFSTGAYNEADYFTEKNLLNVTCGAMEPDLIWDSNAIIWQIKANIKTYLRESTKGWYLLFSELDDCYSGDNSVDFKNQNDHDGEKSISPITLFSKVIYAPTYQPNASNDDPCEYTGNARVFAVNYCTGNAVYNFYGDNDDKNDPQNVIRKFTRLDRYLEIGTDIPSGVSIVIRHGKAAGFISVGGKIYPLPDIDMPGSMIPFYWKEYNN